MDKKVIFTLFFSVLALNSLFSTPLSGFSLPSVSPSSEDICTAPAPDSFKITSRGYNFVSVSWIPAWQGATHTLQVKVRSQSGILWTPVQTVFDVPGDSYTFNDLPDASECLVIISTNCTNGEKSINEVQDYDKIIIELLESGFMPENAEPLDMCQNLIWERYSWLGFKVKEDGGGPGTENVFEVKIRITYDQSGQQETKVTYSRVEDSTMVYAVNEANEFPGMPLNTDNPVKTIMIQPLQPVVDIGRVAMTRYFQNPFKIDLCEVNNSNSQWNPEFEYSVYGVAHPGQGNNGATQKSSEEKENASAFKISNPVTDYFNVILPGFDIDSNKNNDVLFFIYDLQGNQIVKHQFQVASSTVTLPSGALPTGVYILHMYFDGMFHSQKVFKQN